MTPEEAKHAARLAKARTLAEFLRKSAIESLLKVAKEWSPHDWDVMAKRAGLTYRNGAVKRSSEITRSMVIDLLRKEIER